MAEPVGNGVVSAEPEDRARESFYDLDQDSRVTELTQKVELLEQENREMKDRIKKLTIEMEGSEEDKKVFESIAARAADLETEVSRLQHDLITALTEGEEAAADAAELRKSLEERGVKVDELETEVDGLKKEKAEDEKKVRELERKVGLLEVKETEERSRRVRVEEETREKIEEKEREISGLKKKVIELESELNKGKSDKNSVEEALKDSEKKAKEMEVQILQLQKEIEEGKKVISEVKEKALEFESINQNVRGVKRSFEDVHKGFNWQWPVVAATGAVAAAAVVGVCCAKRR